ncbi:MAG: sulfatase-like hydrolase/transferase, partial [Bacteroidota bacterium]
MFIAEPTKWLLLGLFFLLSCSSPSKPAKQKPTTKPNVIYILADDMGRSDLGVYGQQLIETPNLDQLSAEGMTFIHHYAGSTVCAPSRSSLVTGLHTGHTPIRGNKEYLPEGQEPLPD